MRTARVEMLRALGLWFLFLTSVGLAVTGILDPAWRWFIASVFVFVSMVVAWVATD